MYGLIRGYVELPREEHESTLQVLTTAVPSSQSINQCVLENKQQGEGGPSILADVGHKSLTYPNQKAIEADTIVRYARRRIQWSSGFHMS